MKLKDLWAYASYMSTEKKAEIKKLLCIHEPVVFMVDNRTNPGFPKTYKRCKKCLKEQEPARE